MTRGSRKTGPIPPGAVREQGFTLIEIMMVLLLIAMVFTLVIPQFQSRTHADLKRSAMRLAATIEHTFHQSAFRRETLRLHYDLEGSRYWLDRFVDPAANKDLFALSAGGPSGKDDFDRAPEGDEAVKNPAKPHYVVDRKILAEPVTLPEGVFITSVSTQYIEEATEGEAFTHFFPDGYAEPTVLYLADTGGGEYTLYVSPISGRVKVLPGHKEFAVEMKEERT